MTLDDVFPKSSFSVKESIQTKGIGNAIVYFNHIWKDVFPNKKRTRLGQLRAENYPQFWREFYAAMPEGYVIPAGTPELEKYTNLSKIRDELPRLLIVDTGGTITCKRTYDPQLKDEHGNPVCFLEPILPISEVLNSTSAAMHYNTMVVTSPTKGDSALSVPDKQLALAQFICEQIKQHRPDGVIITHGTDSMINSAHALSFLIENLNIPIVMTGAMRDPYHPEWSDAFGNLTSACFFAAAAPIKPDIYVSFGNKLFEGTRVKHHKTTPGDAFTSAVSGQEGCCAELNYSDMQGIGRIAICPRTHENRDSWRRIFYDPPYGIGVPDPFPLVGMTAPRAKIAEVLTTPESIDMFEMIAGAFYSFNRTNPNASDLEPYERELEFYVDRYWDVPIGMRIGVYISGYSGAIRDAEKVAGILGMGIPVIFGSKIALDYIANEGLKYGTTRDLVQANAIFSEDMTPDMSCAKLSIAMGELGRQITTLGRDDLARSDRYNNLVKNIMLTNFRGEVAGPQCAHSMRRRIAQFFDRIPMNPEYEQLREILQNVKAEDKVGL